MKDEELIWEELNRKIVEDFRIFKAHEVLRRSFTGKEATFFELESPDWVNVIARNKQGMFLMVRQFRMGSASLTVEFPAGIVEPEEAPQVAALRELEEETGFRAAKIQLIGQVNPNPAFMTNRSYTYLAEDLQDTGETNWDENESLHPFWMSEKEIDQSMGNEVMNSAIMVQAWYWYKKREF